MLNDPRQFFEQRIVRGTRLWYDRHLGFMERAMGLIRLMLAFLMLLMFILLGGDLFQNVDARGLAIRAREISPLLKLFPVNLITLIIYIFTWENFRYAFPVFGAIASVIISAAYFVKDIYNLRLLSDALRYVASSMSGVRYPHINIDNGQKQIPRKETNLIDAIGGPGHAMIQPGNAVLFHQLRRVSRDIIIEPVLMTRFERIGAVTNLDDQDGFVEEIDVVSRDGIQVKVRNIRFRYRILSETVNGRPVPRTSQNPYPFSRRAYIDLSYSLNVTEYGLQSWAQVVRGKIIGVIENYINTHSIDTLTAPRTNASDPRKEIVDNLFGPELKRSLQNAGTELQWVDIGHFDIVAEEVDRERINLWAADWMGDAEKSRALIEAKRLSSQELGRAEGQAEMLVGIARSLEAIDLDSNRAQNIRHVLLTRTSQILDAMHDNRREDGLPPAGPPNR